MSVKYANRNENEEHIGSDKLIDPLILNDSYIDSSCYPPWNLVHEYSNDKNNYDIDWKCKIFGSRSGTKTEIEDTRLDSDNEQTCESKSGMSSLWVDPSGCLELNTKQNSKFKGWIRYLSSVEGVAIFKNVPCSTRIVQGYVGDCSLLASLSSLSEYERLHKVKLLTSAISLLDTKKIASALEEHQLSNSLCLESFDISIGCKLFFNGSPRCIFVDDYVPIREDGKLLCAHSKDSRELWVTLLEKAFVQLLGRSYTIQATNPGIDIYRLTEWIPEIIQLPSYLNSKKSTESTSRFINYSIDINPPSDTLRWKRIWDNLYSGFNTGACVVCLGTSEIWDAVPSGLGFTEGISSSSGIVSCHAYSVLKVAEVNLGKGDVARLLFLKNPWGKIRWKKKYSPTDKNSWNKNVCKGLNYYPDTHDDGTFWISWEDVLDWFSHLYICWNPKLFSFNTTLHLKWERSELFMNSIVPEDIYLSVFNPQIQLQVSFDEYNAVTVYLLLLQHRNSTKSSFKYLTMHAFKQDTPVICPSMPHVQGVYSNGECILLKFTLIKEFAAKSPFTNNNYTDIQIRADNPNKRNDPSTLASLILAADTCIKCQEPEPILTILLSYYMKKMEKSSFYTLKAYSTGKIKLKEAPSAIGNNWIMNTCEGKWNENSSGGNPNDIVQFFNNPHFRLEFEMDTNVIIILESESPFSVNLRIFKGRAATVRALKTKQVMSSNDYKIHACAISSYLGAGKYTIIPSTFKQGSCGNFRIVIHSEQPSSIFKIPYPALTELSIDVINSDLLSNYHKYTLKTTDIVNIVVTAPTLISIRILFKKNLAHKIAIFGSSNTTKFPKFKDSSSFCTTDVTCCINGEMFCSDISCAHCGGPCGRFFEFDQLEHPLEYSMGYDMCVYSDLHGGISKNGKKQSAAAQQVFQRKSVVNFTLVELLPSYLPYRLVSYGSSTINIISNRDIKTII
ncbi:hypothetical protein BEWA_009390 [Theileria equi strain WA]|uniref:Calpain catalytic domain-containing protein n=1 Tax=Theileria equi strain WA TaxID=1537102 RepID=L0B128_THEEQ|nr:hypothetical protein BEWA_009390 [Theileria equi strain WA]AFZ81525.1 hypothetical protein BEWA_009390 [Theileria equi strain WA]|eukprot:XP_004831191.1 hypothetical protein BEWA_009390 [Theileria equi strain WA]